MIIEWLCSIPNCTLQSVQTSSMASLRMRASIAAESANQLGHEIKFSDGHGFSTASVIFVTKIDLVNDPSRYERWESYIIRAAKNGIKIIIDYTDHHLVSNTAVSLFYKKVLPLATQVICSSNLLSEYVNSHGFFHSTVIEDPIEIDIIRPKTEVSDPLTGLWFGHVSNLPYLIDYLLNEYNPSYSYRLIVMSNSYPLHENYTRRLLSKKLQHLEIYALPWSISDMIAVSKVSDFCLLPTGVSDPRKNGASSNRLITALALGLPVATDSIPSYAPFRDYYAELRTSEFAELLNNPINHKKNIINAQNQISQSLSKDLIKKKWINTIDSIF